MNLEFIESQRGGRKLLRNGYIFEPNYKRYANGDSSWDCILRRNGNQGKAKLRLTEGDVISAEINEHSHNPDPTACELERIMYNIKQKSTTTQNSTQRILQTELQNISESAAVHLTRVDHLKRTIRHQRLEAGGTSPYSKPPERHSKYSGSIPTNVKW